MRQWLGAMVVATLAGCGSDVSIGPDGPATDPGFDVGVEPGTRLRPVMAVAEGVAAFTQWFDGELGVHCRFRPAADLSVRCLPTTPYVVFLDAGCTEPAILQNTCWGMLEFGGLPTEPDVEWCERDPSQGYPELYRRVPGALTNTTFYSGQRTPNGFQCGEMASALEPEEVLERAEPVPFETFVEAERVVVPGYGRLGRLEWHAEDGATEVIDAYDTVYERLCRQSSGGDYADRCVVDRLAPIFADTFVDSACSEVGTNALCDEPVALERTGCDSMRLFEVGAAANASYGGQDGVCEQTSDSGNHLGRELTRDDLPVAVTTDGGTGRLVSRYAVDASGWRIAANPRPLYDRELGVSCDWAYGHCVPTSPSLHQGHYADPSCSEPLLVLPKLDCSRVPEWGWMMADPSCGGIASLHEVQGALDWMTPIFELVDGACVVAALDDDDEIAYALGPARSVDSFAPMAIETW